MENETRQFSRVSFNVVAQLNANGAECDVSHIRNISMSGIFLEGEINLVEGTDCDVTLKLEGVEPAIEFNVAGVVSRVEARGCGIRFTQIPLESYEHLNRIVQLNSDDPSKSEEEIKGHLGLNSR